MDTTSEKPRPVFVMERIAAAVKLYEMGQLSSGAASQLAGVPRPYFLGHLADYGVNTFDLSEEELIHDLKSA